MPESLVANRRASRVVTRLVSGRTNSTNVEVARVFFGTRERLRDRAAFLVRAVFRPTFDDIAAADLPAPLYVPFRVARMSARTLRG